MPVVDVSDDDSNETRSITSISVETRSTTSRSSVEISITIVNFGMMNGVGVDDGHCHQGVETTSCRAFDLLFRV